MRRPMHRMRGDAATVSGEVMTDRRLRAEIATRIAGHCRSDYIFIALASALDEHRQWWAGLSA